MTVGGCVVRRQRPPPFSGDRYVTHTLVIRTPRELEFVARGSSKTVLFFRNGLLDAERNFPPLFCRSGAITIADPVRCFSLCRVILSSAYQCTQWLKLIHPTGALASWAGWSAG